MAVLASLNPDVKEFKPFDVRCIQGGRIESWHTGVYRDGRLCSVALFPKQKGMEIIYMRDHQLTAFQKDENTGKERNLAPYEAEEFIRFESGMGITREFSVDYRGEYPEGVERYTPKRVRERAEYLRQVLVGLFPDFQKELTKMKSSPESLLIDDPGKEAEDLERLVAELIPFL